MNRHVNLAVGSTTKPAGRGDRSLALFGGTPEVGPGRVTPWPAAKRKHIKVLSHVVDSGKYHRVNHPLVSELERRMAEWSEGLSVRAVGSGTAAIHVALDYFKDRGGRVVTSALNWPGAVGPISISGLEPIFVDVEPNLAGLDEQSAISHLGSDASSVLITHLFGNNILAPGLRTAARLKGVALIDDVCQSIAAAKRIVGG